MQLCLHRKRKLFEENKDMKFFSRIKDIVSSNVNHALDKLEDPQKMIKLMIDQMGDTLVEARTSLAASIASKKRCESQKKVLDESINRWEKRANMAVEKGLDDLAREALVEKKSLLSRIESLSQELATYQSIIESKQEQIVKLEEKLQQMKDQAGTMTARVQHAEEKIKTEKQIHDTDGADIIRKFQEFENKVDKLEAEAQMAGFYGSRTSESKFAAMESDEEIEKELEALKASLKTEKTAVKVPAEAKETK